MSIEAGIFAPTMEKAKVKQLMMQCGQAAYLVVDSSKLNLMEFSKICDLKDFTGVITDNQMSEAHRQLLKKEVNVI